MELIDDVAGGAPGPRWHHALAASVMVAARAACAGVLLVSGCGGPVKESEAPVVRPAPVQKAGGDETGNEDDNQHENRDTQAHAQRDDDGGGGAVRLEEKTDPPMDLSQEAIARARQFQPIVHEAAAQHGVDPHLINGIIWHESKFNPRARGPSGARGLMQLMPRTSKSLARRLERPHRPYDPDFNVHAGTLLISRLLDKFDGDETVALAAYARGSGRVRGWLDEGQPFPEGVLRFVRKVKRGQATFAIVFADAAPTMQAATP